MSKEISIIRAKNSEANGKTLYVETTDGEILFVPFTDKAKENIDKWYDGTIDADELLARLGDGNEYPKHVDTVKNEICSHLEKITERISTNGLHLFFDGDSFEKVQIDEVLEDHLVRLMEHRNDNEKNMSDWKSYVAFTENLYNNVDADIRSDFVRWLDSQNWLTFTEDGCFIGYKGCRKNIDSGIAESIHTGPGIVDGIIYNGHIPNPDGAVVEIPRSRVVKDPATGCASGMHVGTYTYARDFAQGIICRVKVNPRDVISVPYDCAAQKIRCCRYEVLDHEEFVRKPDQELYDHDMLTYHRPGEPDYDELIEFYEDNAEEYGLYEDPYDVPYEELLEFYENYSDDYDLYGEYRDYDEDDIDDGYYVDDSEEDEASDGGLSSSDDKTGLGHLVESINEYYDEDAPVVATEKPNKESESNPDCPGETSKSGEDNPEIDELTQRINDYIRRKSHTGSHDLPF